MKPLISIASALLFLSACQPAHSQSPRAEGDIPQDKGHFVALKKQISQDREALAQFEADQSCESDNQCKVIGYGKRPCGGPAAFVLISTKQHAESDVTAVANRLTKAESQLQSLGNMMGICQHLVLPQAQCVNSSCSVAGPEQS